jgi:hypothetical protein
MLVIGARFRTLAAARAALRAVRASVAVPPGDVAVRALGSTRYDAPEDQFLLAGRFDPADAAEITAIVHSQGGRVIERRSDIVRGQAAPPVATTPVATGPSALGAATPGRLAARLASRPTAPTAGMLRGHVRATNWLRRPSPPLRLRTARGSRLEG